MTPYTEGFSAEPIPDSIFEIMKGKSFKAGCTVPREDLAFLRVRYVDLHGKRRTAKW